VLALVAAFAGAPGCESEKPTPPPGSGEFEAARKEMQDVRRKEYGRESLEPGKKAAPAKEAGAK
jgi:hypothetical protein